MIRRTSIGRARGAFGVMAAVLVSTLWFLTCGDNLIILPNDDNGSSGGNSSPTTYKVTYDANSGVNEPNAQIKTHAVALTLSSDLPTRTGYTFTGWNTREDGGGTAYDAGASYTANAAVTLYAQWSIKTYEVTFNSQGGSPVSPQTVNHGGRATAPTAPTRTGYTFASWYKEAGYVHEWDFAADAVTASITLYAKWTPVTPNITYTVRFNANGGSGSVPASQTVDAGDRITLPNGSGLNNSGYTFGGWNTNNAGTGTTHNANSSYTPTGNITLYAKWTPVTYNVTYHANGAGVTGIPTAQTKTHGVALTLSSDLPARSGYTFNGWNTLANGSGDAYTAGGSYTANAAVTLYAQWTPPIPPTTYNVTYNANGGSVTPSTATTGADGKLASLPTPTRSGYTFVGWFTAATGGTQVTTSTIFSADATIHAQWMLKTYTVTFNANGGSVSPTSGTTGVGWTLSSLPTPTPPPGEYFAGWFTTEATGGAAVTTSTVFSADATIYARWALTPITMYTVMFDANGGSAVSDMTGVPDGSIITAPTAPNRTGYTFGGWYKEAMLTNVWNFSTDVVSGDVTLYAKWTPTSYAITYNLEGGTNNSNNPASYTIESAITLNNPTRTGYEFVGWTGSNGTTPQTSVTISQGSTGDKTYTANWAQVYTITFHANFGTGTVPSAISETAVTGTPLPPGDGLSRTNLVFNGWNTEANGTGTHYSAGASYTTNATADLYAQWGVDYNGKIHKTVTIERDISASSDYTDPSATSPFVWMAENLNTSSGTCYNNTAACETYGKLYSQGDAYTACATATGWKLPIDNDWTDLLTTADNTSPNPPHGTKLKSKTGWTSPTVVGTDAFGFSALPGGYGNDYDSFSTLGTQGYWWSATGSGQVGAYYYRVMQNNSETVNRYDMNQDNLMSVRCMLNQ